MPQEVLTAICARLQGQARSIQELQGRVDFVVKSNADGQKELAAECLARFEAKLAEFAAAAEASGAAAKRVRGRCSRCFRILPNFSRQQAADARVAAPSAKQALLERVADLEARLEGTEALGHTVGNMAAVLGVAVHQASSSAADSAACGDRCL